MLFKKKRSIYSENPDVIKICATCKFGRELASSGDVSCLKHGIVARDNCCKHYDYNRLLKRPPRKRKAAGADFTAEDFSID